MPALLRFLNAVKANRIFAFFSQNAIALCSLCVAIASVVIAIRSLEFATQSQKSDAEHKELLIRPRLGIQANTEDFSIRLTNKGLGPAVIREVHYLKNGKCLAESSNTNAKQNDKKFGDEVQSLVQQYMMIGLQVHTQGTSRSGILPFPMPIVRVLSQDLVIAAGESTILFGYEKASLQKYLMNLEKISSRAALEFGEDFLTKSYTFPLNLKYCSMSGRYCETISFQGCPSN